MHTQDPTGSQVLREAADWIDQHEDAPLELEHFAGIAQVIYNLCELNVVLWRRRFQR